MTETEYLAFERDSAVRHAFIDGEIFAMGGASRNHNLITSSVIATLYAQLRGKGCEIYPSDMKVRTPATGSYAYPDVTVVCGEARFADDQRDVLLNPTVIVEVLSPATEAFDRGVKSSATANWSRCGNTFWWRRIARLLNGLCGWTMARGS